MVYSGRHDIAVTFASPALKGRGVWLGRVPSEAAPLFLMRFGLSHCSIILL